jgi:hypothetical protein
MNKETKNKNAGENNFNYILYWIKHNKNIIVLYDEYKLLVGISISNCLTHYNLVYSEWPHVKYSTSGVAVTLENKDIIYRKHQFSTICFNFLLYILFVDLHIIYIYIQVGTYTHMHYFSIIRLLF